MSIRNFFFLSALVLCASCSSDLFLDHNGNMPDAEKVSLIHEGQTKEQVLDILGGPSLVTGLSDDHWVYMSSTVKKIAFLRPQETDRQILALTFDQDQLTKIEKRTLQDGNDISIDSDETKPADRQVGFFRKYFGGVGSYTPFGGTSNKGL
ncbi:MAG: outer membrane protein assembly factor BamE [Alphaproteobacteria bacterium]|nr:outer membrane protein assembly factor BamE [Alphaproteobacteria bacterium]